MVSSPAIRGLRSGDVIAGRIPIFGQPRHTGWSRMRTWSRAPPWSGTDAGVSVVRGSAMSLCDGAVEVPEILPGLALLQRKTWPFDEAAVAVDARDRFISSS